MASPVPVEQEQTVGEIQFLIEEGTKDVTNKQAEYDRIETEQNTAFESRNKVRYDELGKALIEAQKKLEKAQVSLFTWQEKGVKLGLDIKLSVKPTTGPGRKISLLIEAEQAQQELNKFLKENKVMRTAIAHMQERSFIISPIDDGWRIMVRKVTEQTSTPKSDNGTGPRTRVTNIFITKANFGGFMYTSLPRMRTGYQSQNGWVPGIVQGKDEKNEDYFNRVVSRVEIRETINGVTSVREATNQEVVKLKEIK